LEREIKKSSIAFINENKLLVYKFQWQEGFGVFSYAHSKVDKVVKYVMNQKGHYKNKTFKSEYMELLKKNEIEFKEEYLFDFLNETS